MKKSLSLIIGCAILIGCTQKKEINNYEVAKEQVASQKEHNHDHEGHNHEGHDHTAHSKPAASKPAVSNPAAFEWAQPSNWKEGKKSSMRLASFNIPHGDKTADCSIIKLTGQAGGVTANINRWRVQVGLPQESDTVIKQHIKEIKSPMGTFQFVKLINPEAPDNAILASMCFKDSFVLFVKATADSATINGVENEFIDFCKTIKN